MSNNLYCQLGKVQKEEGKGETWGDFQLCQLLSNFYLLTFLQLDVQLFHFFRIYFSTLSDLCFPPIFVQLFHFLPHIFSLLFFLIFFQCFQFKYQGRVDWTQNIREEITGLKTSGRRKLGPILFDLKVIWMFHMYMRYTRYTWALQVYFKRVKMVLPTKELVLIQFL